MSWGWGGRGRVERLWAPAHRPLIPLHAPPLSNRPPPPPLPPHAPNLFRSLCCSCGSSRWPPCTLPRRRLAARVPSISATRVPCLRRGLVSAAHPWGHVPCGRCAGRAGGRRRRRRGRRRRRLRRRCRLKLRHRAMGRPRQRRRQPPRRRPRPPRRAMERRPPPRRRRQRLRPKQRHRAMGRRPRPRRLPPPRPSPRRATARPPPPRRRPPRHPPQCRRRRPRPGRPARLALPVAPTAMAYGGGLGGRAGASWARGRAPTSNPARTRRLLAQLLRCRQRPRPTSPASSAWWRPPRMRPP